MIVECFKFRKQDPLQQVQLYKISFHKKLSGELLENAYESTKKNVSPIFAAAAFGATIASDGWKDAQRLPIFNLCL